MTRKSSNKLSAYDAGAPRSANFLFESPDDDLGRSVNELLERALRPRR